MIPCDPTALFVMMTSFTRIVIVLAFVRRALATQSIPPTVAVMGLALFLTLYTMAPTFERINATAIQPYLADEIDFSAAGKLVGNNLKEFMLRQCRKADLVLFVKMAKTRDKHVVLLARQCGKCLLQEKPPDRRVDALRALLTVPELRVWSEIVIDKASAVHLLSRPRNR